MGIFWDKLFPPKRVTNEYAKILPTTGLTSFSGGAYSSDIYRSAVDAIARNIGKLKGSHVITGDGVKKPGDRQLNRLLQLQPNPIMTSYDLLYKLATHYYLYNNAFAYLDKQNGQIKGIYPIDTVQTEFLETPSGELFTRFTTRAGDTFVFPYRNLIHLRRNFNSDALLGDSNDALYPALELAHSESESIINGINTSASLRGILKFTNVLNKENLEKQRVSFIDQFLSSKNNNGVIVLDNEKDFTPINSTPIPINPEQLKLTQNKIYSYLGVSEKIVNSTYSEDDWGAFYESVIEPFAYLMGLEFTRKVFTERETAFGNKIEFASGSLIYASNQAKINLIKELVPMSLLTINQALEILNLPPIDGGDKRLQSLNYVDADKANMYQLEGK